MITNHLNSLLKAVTLLRVSGGWQGQAAVNLKSPLMLLVFNTILNLHICDRASPQQPQNTQRHSGRGPYINSTSRNKRQLSW